MSSELIKPFIGLRPVEVQAHRVIAPPYDVLSSDEARALAQHNPFSFLHISKAEIDLSPNINPYDVAVYQQAKINLEKLMNQHVLVSDERPAYYIYRMRVGNKQQTGVVVAASCRAYLENRIRKHELTRKEKEDDRIALLKAVDAQLSPVLLCYRYQKNIDQILQHVTQKKPLYDELMLGDVAHSLWRVADSQLIQSLSDAFNAMAHVYIADGHHRSASCARYQPDQYFLAVLFPDNEMHIMSYHRLVKDLSGLSPEDFLEKISEKFVIEPSDEAINSRNPGEFGLYLGRQWYRLQFRHAITGGALQVLDVSLLHDHLIAPILGIHDVRNDKRIDFVGGIRGTDELERRVNSGEMALAFSLPPTTLAQLFAVADQQQIMPPKSTWFEPKLADGMISFRRL